MVTTPPNIWISPKVLIPEVFNTLEVIGSGNTTFPLIFPWTYKSFPTYKSEVIVDVPTTSKVSVGSVIPIPNLPLLVSVINIVELTLLYQLNFPFVVYESKLPASKFLILKFLLE